MAFLVLTLTLPKVGATFSRLILLKLTLPVRTTRSRIVHLRNDHKELMNRVEKFLHEHFANASDDESAAPLTNGATSSAGILPDADSPVLDEPFARVNTVAPSSPAERAGLKAGDEIRNFGYVNRSNHDNLKKVGECVAGNEGVSLLGETPESLWLTCTSKIYLSRCHARQGRHSARNYA